MLHYIFLEPLAQTKPQVANLKPPNKIIPSNTNSNVDSENESSPMKSPLANNTLQKITKKPVTMQQLPTNKPTTATATSALKTPAKPLT